jgi:hypothetical protein
MKCLTRSRRSIDECPNWYNREKEEEEYRKHVFNLGSAPLQVTRIRFLIDNNLCRCTGVGGPKQQFWYHALAIARLIGLPNPTLMKFDNGQTKI